MADKLMYNPNDDTQNYPICRLQLVVKRLDTKLNEPTNHNSLKSPPLLSQRIRKRYYKTMGTSVINNPLSLFAFMVDSSSRLSKQESILLY